VAVSAGSKDADKEREEKMPALSRVLEESLCRACSGRLVVSAAEGDRLQKCPQDEERQAECLSRLLYRMACLDEALRHYASGKVAGTPELRDIIDFWAKEAMGPDADPNRLCFRDILLRQR
jgi:hypothetical protein